MHVLRVLLLCASLLPTGCDAPTTAAPDAAAEIARAETTGGADSVPAGTYSGFVASGPRLREMLGVSTHMSRGVEYSWKREAELDRLEELGFSRVRSDFYWKNIEAEEGVYDVAGEAHMTDLCLARSLSVLGILLIPPGWAQTDGTFDSVDPEQWRAFVRYTVGEMKDRIKTWEIWNEPNLHVFWTPAPNPYRFGLFLSIAAEEIRALDPDAEVVFGGLSPFGFHKESIWGFLLDVATVHPDVCDAFDALAIHPYSFAQQHAPEDVFTQGTYVHPPMTGLIGEARAVLDRIGCPGRPVDLTEAGWPHYYMGEEKQGAYAARGLLLAAAAGARSYYWYTFWDSEIGPDEPAPTECTFGLMTVPQSAESPGVEKPSFHAMKGVGLILGDTRYAGDLGARLGWEEPHHALAFVDDGGRFTVALWHAQDALDDEVALAIPLPGGAAGWRRYDQAGALVESGTADPATILAAGRVSYLAFD